MKTVRISNFNPLMQIIWELKIPRRRVSAKNKEVFAFDDGLPEQQGRFITVTRPILSALMFLDSSPDEEGEGEPGPDEIWEMLEDALVILRNAMARLNIWRQGRFSEFLTELGKRTLREGIPTNTHLFTHQFHEKIKSKPQNIKF